MSSKRKADCTPEEWAAHLARVREYNVKYRSDPERLATYNTRRREAYAKRQTDPDYRAQFLASTAVRNASPAQRAIDKKRNMTPDRKKASTERQRQRLYGLDPATFGRILARQNNACAVCQRPFGVEGGARSQHVDHCHDTGAVRGLLCAACNSIEGKFRALGLTPMQFAERLQAYLDNPPAQEEILW